MDTVLVTIECKVNSAQLRDRMTKMTTLELLCDNL